MWGTGLRGNSATGSAFCQFAVISPASHNQIGPFWCWFLDGWICACSRSLWVSPTNSPVMLGVSPDISTPAGVFSQRLWDFISPALEPCVASSVLLPSCSSQFICRRMWDCLVRQLPPRRKSSPPGCLSLPLLLVWVNASSLTPWLSDFHTVQFSVSSCFLFLNLLLSFFQLCEEAQCVYLCLHLGRKSWLFHTDLSNELRHIITQQPLKKRLLNVTS